MNPKLLILIILCTTILPGCSQKPAASAHWQGQDSADHLSPPRADGQERTFVVSPRRLHEDLRRSMAEAHWAVVRIEKPVNPATTQPNGDAAPVLRAWALLPDGRTAAIAAWVAPPSEPGAVRASAERPGPGADHDDPWLRDPITLRLRVSVGRLGDAEAERFFLDALEETLRGPALPRRIRFELP